MRNLTSERRMAMIAQLTCRRAKAVQWVSSTDWGKFLKMPLAAGLCVAVAACGSGSGDSGPPDDGTDEDISEVPLIPETPETVVDTSDPEQCNVATQNQWVYGSMQDYYLFYDQVPVVNPQSYDSPEALIKDIRFEERDPFSHIADAGASSLQFAQGREFGLGFAMGYDSEGLPRLARVTREGPFGLLGLQRGDILISVDGVAWADLDFDDEFFDKVFGNPDAPGNAQWVIRKRDSNQLLSAEITATEYDINTVLQYQVLTDTAFNGIAYNGNIGYLAFSRFLSTSRAELNTAFAGFRQAGITDLVLDLRYNRGGLIVIAEQLASLIAGDSVAGEMLLEYRFNDKYSDRNLGLFFIEGVGDLGLSRVIVLTGPSTASSSEIVIGGLQPYMDVVTMGRNTSGKPYVQIPRDRCGQRLNAIEAEGFNAADESVFGGVAATCFAADDLTRDFGAAADGRSEGMLDAALQYLVAGACSSNPLLAAQRSTSNGATWNGIYEPGGALH